MGEAADESESEVVGDVQAGGGQGDKRQGQGDGQEGEPGRELGEKIVGTGKVGDGRLEDQEDQVQVRTEPIIYLAVSLKLLKIFVLNPISLLSWVFLKIEKYLESRSLYPDFNSLVNVI